MTTMKYSAMCLAGMAALCLIGCGDSRMLPAIYMPTVPKECEQVLAFKVQPLPSGKSNAAKLSVDLAREGAIRSTEHEISRVCAEYALRTAGVMKDKDKSPAPGEPVVAAATTVPKTRTVRPERPLRSEDNIAAQSAPGS